jgi:diguanylate cyclase (GGDEF)-like protein/PAS domain S-box-containing protein
MGGDLIADSDPQRAALQHDVDVDTLLETVYSDLRKSRDLFRILFEQSPNGVVLIDPFDSQVPDRIIALNDSYARMNGYTVDELIGKSVGILLTDYSSSPEELREYVETVRAQGTLTDWCDHVRKDGTIFPVEFSTSVVTVAGREYTLGVDRDISERRQAEEMLRHNALHDPLTELPHRGLFHDRLERALLTARRSQTPMALLFIDLDGFKAVNDTHGHAVGDAVLHQVAQRLLSVVRATDTVARVGGDEFAIVLPGEGLSGAVEVADKVLHAVAQPYAHGLGPIAIGASIGIAIHPEGGEESEILLQSADDAMYVAKRSHRGYAIAGE